MVGLSPSEEKKSLRRDMIEKRLLCAQNTHAHQEACARAIAFLDKQDFTCAGLYHPINSEMSPLPILEWCASQKKITALPFITGKGIMVFRQWRCGDPIKKGSFNIHAPLPEAPFDQPDLYIVPLLGFNKNGHRLGYGGGFYDRYFSRLERSGAAYKALGLAFEEQYCPALKTEAHDRPLHALFTQEKERFF